MVDFHPSSSDEHYSLLIEIVNYNIKSCKTAADVAMAQQRSDKDIVHDDTQ
jgi:hypothetical protein